MEKITFQEMLEGEYDYGTAMDLVSDAMFLDRCHLEYQDLIEEYLQSTVLLKRLFNGKDISYDDEYHALLVTRTNGVSLETVIELLRDVEDSQDLKFLDDFLNNYIPLTLLDEAVGIQPSIRYSSSAKLYTINPFNYHRFGDSCTARLAKAVHKTPCSDYYRKTAFWWMNACCDYLNRGNPQYHSYILGDVKRDFQTIFCDRNLTLWSEYPHWYPFDWGSDINLRQCFAMALGRIQQLFCKTVESFFSILQEDMDNVLDKIDDHNKIYIYTETYLEHRQVQFLVNNNKLTHILDDQGNVIEFGFVDSHY